jgi:hypothetical protein
LLRVRHVVYESHVAKCIVCTYYKHVAMLVTPHLSTDSRVPVAKYLSNRSSPHETANAEVENLHHSEV